MGWRTYELEETAWSLRRAGSDWSVAVQLRARNGCAQIGVWFRQRLVSPGPLNRLAVATPALVGFTNEMCQTLWARGYQGSFDWDRSGTVRGRFRRTVAGWKLRSAVGR